MAIKFTGDTRKVSGLRARVYVCTEHYHVTSVCISIDGSSVQVRLSRIRMGFFIED